MADKTVFDKDMTTRVIMVAFTVRLPKNVNPDHVVFDFEPQDVRVLVHDDTEIVPVSGGKVIGFETQDVIDDGEEELLCTCGNADD